MTYFYIYLICIKTSGADTCTMSSCLFGFNFSMILCEHSTIHEIKISAIDHFIKFLPKYMWCTYYILKEARQRQE